MKAVKSMVMTAEPRRQRWLQLIDQPWFALASIWIGLFASLPPLNWWPLSFLAFVPFLRFVLLGRRGVNWVAFIAGAGYWAALNASYFVALPLAGFALYPLVTRSIAVLVFCLGATVAGGFWWLYSLLVRRINPTTIWTMIEASLLWTAMETIASFVFWHLTQGTTIGYSLPPTIWFGQIASLGSVWSISLGLILCNWLVAALIVSQPAVRKRFFLWLVGFMLVWLTLGGWLALRTRQHMTHVPVISAAAAQVANSEAHHPDYPALIQHSQVPPSSLVVLPELAESLTSDQLIEPRVVFQSLVDRYQAVLATHLTLILGVNHLTAATSWNEANLLTAAGFGGRAIKERLMPWGEYLPFARFWPLQIQSAYSLPGHAPTTALRGSFGAIGVVFCNEAFQPFLVADRTRAGAIIFADLAKDTAVATRWWTPWQVRVVQYRAVESRRSFILATDHGQSALILPTGRTRALAPYNQDLVLQAELPLLRDHSLWASIARSTWWIAFGGLLVCEIFRTRRLKGALLN